MTWTWKWPGNSTTCIHRRLGSSFHNATCTQSLPGGFWDDADHPEWGTVERFDHRTLQHAHDLLAAVWRFRHDLRQPGLAFVDKHSLNEVQTLWLDWLRHEITGWVDYPDRVRLVQLILTNQNKQPGCIAESQLSLNIINGFTDVPWDQEWREASEAGLAKHREKMESKE